MLVQHMDTVTVWNWALLSMFRMYVLHLCSGSKELGLKSVHVIVAGGPAGGWWTVGLIKMVNREL